jgi:inosose dehydratase
MKIAINPLQWFTLHENGIDMSLELETDMLLRWVADCGFSAVLADVHPVESVISYREKLRTFDLQPAPGYFDCDLADPARLATTLQRASEFCECQVALGLREACLADELHGERLLGPPSTHEEISDERVADMSHAIEEIALMWRRRGLTPCLHNHVGSYIETEREIDTQLSRLDASLLSFCPDTGHLRWAGIDPRGMIRRHRARVRLMHIKDVREDVLQAGIQRGWGYGAFVRSGLWAEPGAGGLDLVGIIEELGHFGGWLMIEVDHSMLEEPRTSTLRCAEWCRELKLNGGSGGAIRVH